MAHLKVRPFKTSVNLTFSAACLAGEEPLFLQAWVQPARKSRFLAPNPGARNDNSTLDQEACTGFFSVLMLEWAPNRNRG
jgi:hypothetical protein